MRRLLGVVLEDEHDVEALEVELDTLEVHQLYAVQDDDEWWLRYTDAQRLHIRLRAI